MPYSLTLSHVGIFVSDIHRMVDFYVDLSLPDAELWALIEKHARETPGFRPQAEWKRDIERRIAAATASRQTAREAVPAR